MKQSSGGNGYHYAVRRNDEAPVAGLFHFHKYARYLSSTKKNKSPHVLAAKVYDALLSAEKQAGVRYAQPKKNKKTFALIFRFLSLMAL